MSGRWLLSGVLVVLSSAFLAAPAVAQTDYLTGVQTLADTVATLDADAQEASRAYDAGETSPSETLLAFQEVEVETQGVQDGLEFLTVPDDLLAQHTELVNQSQRMVTAAAEMIVGLESTDTGEARNAALVTYTDAATTFINVVDTLDPTSDTTTTSTPTTDGTDTTTTTTSAGTTSTVDGTTSTTAAAQGDTGGDGGGTSLVTIILVLIIGAVIGVVGGLLLGAGVRRDLMRQLRIARGDHPPTSQR